MENDKEALLEEINILYDDIEYYNEILRQYQNFGKPFPDPEDTEESIENHINSLENEVSYLERCLEDEF